MRRRRMPKINLRPYGFCCQPAGDDDSLFAYNHMPALETSLASIHSLHECPAFKLRERIITKRPPKSSDSLLGLQQKQSLGSLRSGGDAGGGLGKHQLTESEIDLLIDEERRQRQLEYEERMDRWAEIGRRKVKQVKIKLKHCCCPWWYSEFSLSQLKLLKELEDVMFKDKEEKTSSRTIGSLASMGMITDTVKVKSSIIRNLIFEYSTEPIKFLCEIYRALRGQYFEEEGNRDDYKINERIILSAIAFLELPRIIIELHRRMSPMIKTELPPKPDKPIVVIPKKKESPLLEKPMLPYNWRLYEKRLFIWHEKCLEIPRPVAILPKDSKKEDDKKETELDVELEVEKNIKDDKARKKKKDQAISDKKRQPSESKVVQENDLVQEKKVDIIEDGEEDKCEIIEIQPQPSCTIDEDIDPFPMNTNWTTPPTPCPYKYQKLMKELGPLKTDEEFFSALKICEPKKDFPSGRENLPLNIQHLLLDVEADFHHMTEEANKMTFEVEKIINEIARAERRCDPCCSCRQTRMINARWHATKSPFMVIENVVAGLDDNKPHVIGATVMESPADSMTTLSEPPCVPSKDKLVKNPIIAGTTALIDGAPVNMIAGNSRTYDREPHRYLIPDDAAKPLRNVPPCECADDKTEEELITLKSLIRPKDEDKCYGKKYRPKEGPAYSCQEFCKTEEVEEKDDCGCEEEVPQCLEDDCGCDEGAEMCDSEDEMNEDYVNHRKKGEKKEAKRQDGGKKKEKVKEDNVCRKLCKRCKRKMKVPCNGGKDEAKVTPDCSCDSLAEFLQMDITKKKCVKPKKEVVIVELEKQRLKSLEFDPCEEILRKRHEAQMKDKKHYEVIRTSTDSKKSRGSKRSSGGKRKDSNASRNSNNAGKDRRGSKDSRRQSQSDKNGKDDALKDKDDKTEENKSKKGTSKKTLEKDYNEKTANDRDGPLRPEDVGPFGCRTKSEEALPTERTIAYLTVQHPPEKSAEQIPVRKGGRPCRCRENRNKRKNLIFNVGGHARDPKDQEAVAPVVDGVYWLSPVPSIRRSDEYIPEYELQDSPFEKMICSGKRKEQNQEEIREQKSEVTVKSVLSMKSLKSSELESEMSNLTRLEKSSGKECVASDEEDKNERSKDWDNAFKDEDLTNFLAKKRDKVPCWTKCAKFKKGKNKSDDARKLKVMKPVCECKYERKIVKRNEERKHWHERQARLKTYKKESFLHIAEMTKLTDMENEPPEVYDPCNPEANLKRLNSTQMVISAITMQTPFATPVQSRVAGSHLPFTPLPEGAGKKEEKAEEPAKEEAVKTKGKKKKKGHKEGGAEKDGTHSPKRKKSGGQHSTKQKLHQLGDEAKKGDDKEVTDVVKLESGAEEKTVKLQTIKKPRMSLLDDLEEKWMLEMRGIVEQMTEEDFISVKLPHYHKMPQLAYWVSYRAKGMHFTKQYINQLMKLSKAIWKARSNKIRRMVSAEEFIVNKKERRTLNFDRALYWKRRITKMKTEFYTSLRRSIVEYGQEYWRTMEFGKFPNILFKQAYFTYLPATEKDTYAVCPF